MNGKVVFVAYTWVDDEPKTVKVLGRDQVNAQLYCQVNGYELGIVDVDKLETVN